MNEIIFYRVSNQIKFPLKGHGAFFGASFKERMEVFRTLRFLKALSEASDTTDSRFQIEADFNNSRFQNGNSDFVSRQNWSIDRSKT